MQIYIPNSAWLGNIDPFLRTFDTNDSSKLEVISHPKWFSVHPVVLAMIAAIGLDQKKGKKTIIFPQLEARSKHYLQRMGLLNLLGLEKKIDIKEHESAGRFIPLTQITDNATLSSFIEEMVPLLHLQPDQVKPIRYIVSELARNVFEHANSAVGAILCAQYYVKSNTIRLGIVDRGVGIKQTMDVAYQTAGELESIQLALTPGITGTTRRIGGTEQNAGAGLFFIKSIAKVNRDFFMIYSGNSMYKLLKTPQRKSVRLYADPFRDAHSADSNFPYWQGTVVGVDLNLDSKKEFNDLLNLISATYSKTVKERRKEYYKRKARFI